MNEGLLYSSIPMSNTDVFNKLNNEILREDRTNDLKSNEKVRKYFPETWIWTDKIAEYV